VNVSESTASVWPTRAACSKRDERQPRVQVTVAATIARRRDLV